jgi:hypothetical protein
MKISKSHDQFIKEVKILHPNLEIIGTYIKGNHKILVKTKYGLCNVLATSLLNKGNPCITTALNKTEYFINQCKELYGDKYGYSKVEYINHNTSVKIEFSTNVFRKYTPNFFLSSSFTQCINNLKKPYYRNIGWSYTQWKEAADQSKNFDSFKVYIIKCWNENEEFYKIGKTFLTINQRFKTIGDRRCLMLSNH